MKGGLRFVVIRTDVVGWGRVLLWLGAGGKDSGCLRVRITVRCRLGVAHCRGVKVRAKATARANDCYRALYEAGQKQGFLPYRLNIDAMSTLNTSGSAFSRLASQLKAAVDPNFILAPGRYVPGIKHSEV